MGVIWAEFKREFTERFFPKSYKDCKVEEFYILEQGSSSVPEYEKKFSELIRLVPFFTENEQEKINRFMAGLNPTVRTIVTSASLLSRPKRIHKWMALSPKDYYLNPQ